MYSGQRIKMKVAINTLAHRTSGGGITYLKNILPRLAKTEHEFVVFVPADRDVLGDLATSNIQFHEVDLPMTIIPILLLYEQLVVPYQMRRLDIDVLYSPADIAPLLAPCPVVLAIRNPNPYFAQEVHTGWLKVKFRIQHLLTKLSAQRADRVLFVSEYSQNLINDKLNLDPANCKTIHHGIDPESLKGSSPEQSTVGDLLDEHAPYVLSVSTIHRHKNYDCLIKAYAALPKSLRSQYPLMIVGRAADQQYYDELLSLISELNLMDDVVFTGEVTYEEIGYLYREAAVYVLPSKLETFGHTLLEAMTFGIPVVAADSTAIPEIAGNAARYFAPDDPESLANELARVLEDDEVANQLVKNGHDRVNQFSWDRNVQQLVEKFEGVYEENR